MDSEDTQNQALSCSKDRMSEMILASSKLSTQRRSTEAWSSEALMDAKGLNECRC
jgi:hypothetical protein